MLYLSSRGERSTRSTFSVPPAGKMHATAICLFLEGSFTPLLGANEGLTAANCTLQQAASGPVQPRPPEATRRGAVIRQPPGQVQITKVFVCTVQTVKFIFRIFIFYLCIEMRSWGRVNTVWNVWAGHRKAQAGRLESDPFSKSLLRFPSRLCFKTGKLLAFEKYPLPICCTAAPLVITSPLPSALVERR